MHLNEKFTEKMALFSLNQRIACAMIAGSLAKISASKALPNHMKSLSSSAPNPNFFFLLMLKKNTKFGED